MNNHKKITQDITETHTLREGFDLEHRLYRHIADYQADHICRFNKGGTLTFANRTFINYFGQTENELLGMSFLELVSEADRAITHREIQQLTVQNPVRTFTNQIKNTYGETKWLQWACTAFFDKRENLVEVQAAGKDITRDKQSGLALKMANQLLEKKEREQTKKLIESESCYRLIFENSAIAMMMVDEKTGIIRNANPATEILLAINQAYLIGKKYKNLLLDNEHQVLSLISNTNGSIYKVLPQKGKLQRYVEVISSLFTEEEQRLRLLILNDITEQVTAEQALIKEKELFHLTHENIQDGVITFDQNNIIHLINTAALQIMNISREEAVGQPAGSLPLLAEIIYKLPPVPVKGKKESLITWEPVNESRKVLDITKQQMLLSGNSAVGSVLVIRDVTKEKQLEKQIFLSQKLRSIGLIASGVAHEINTPVQYIGNNLWFLKKHMNELLDLTNSCDSGFSRVYQEFLLQEIPDAIHSSIEGIDRIIRIIRNMQDLTHPSQDDHQLIDVNTTLNNAINLVQKKISLDIGLETDFDSNLPDVVGSFSDLMQVWLNLLNNAGDAVEDVLEDGTIGDGHIKVMTKLKNQCIVVKIVDNGVGIKPEDQHMIFDLFYTTKDVGRGSGQGLPLVHDIVTNKFGGTIDIESDPGKGTTVIVKLPT